MFSTRSIFRFLRSQLFIIGLAAAAVIFFMYRYFALKEKAAAADKPPVPDIPNNGKNIPAGYITTAQSIASQLFQVTEGIFTSAAKKESVFVTLYNLTDDQLVYVYTVFNNLYFNTNKESMTATIKAEINVSIGGVRDSLVSRLTALNCP